MTEVGKQKGCYQIGTAALVEVGVEGTHTSGVEVAAAEARMPSSQAIAPTIPGSGSDSVHDSDPSPNRGSCPPSRSPT